MLANLKGRPLWYKAWAATTGLAALFVVVRLFYIDELKQVDHALLAFALVSGLISSFLVPPENADTHMSQKKRAIIITFCFGAGLIAALIL